MSASSPTRAEVHQLWRQFVNPDYVELLEAFDYGRHFVWAQGTKLRDVEGRIYTDFLAGFGVHNAGHNPPRLLRRLGAELEACGPSMLNIDAPLPAGELAQRLSETTHPLLCRTAFASSGTEAVEIALKAVRAATGRSPILACHGAWHGLSTGALALMGDTRHRAGVGPLLPEVIHVPFGDAEALEQACRQHRPAGFFVEPIQGEGGIQVPAATYLQDAAEICRKAGCLLVVDEIQTGLGRTGRLFATDFTAVVPDLFLVGKALSGGLVPVAATLMTSAVWRSAFAGPSRCSLCASTFGAGRLAMTTGLEMLNLVEEEQLADRAHTMGDLLRTGLEQLAEEHPMIGEIRGQGLLQGIAFQMPSGFLASLVPRWTREQLFAQVLAAVLLRDHRLILQCCGLAPNVLRIEPPLVITPEEIAELLKALDQVLGEIPSFFAATWAAVRKTALGGEL